VPPRRSCRRCDEGVSRPPASAAAVSNFPRAIFREHDGFAVGEYYQDVLNLGYYACMTNKHRREPDSPMAESQLVELRNMRVLLEEARVLARDLAYHRRARLEAALDRALHEVDHQIEDLRRDQG
jgi:hypothetical protein